MLLVSRHPQACLCCYPSSSTSLTLTVYDKLSSLGSQILPPHAADITSSDPSALEKAFEGASAVVSMAGLLAASKQAMIDVQQTGAENVARAAKKQGVQRMVMLSAIGSDELGVTP